MCNRPVQAYKIKHKGSKHWDIEAKCHGYVEVQAIDWDHWSDGEPEPDVLRNHIRSMVYFRPEHWEQASNG